MFYVRLNGVSDGDLEFLGYVLAGEDTQFKVYIDRQGEQHIVDKANPVLYVEDINDASTIQRRSSNPEAFVPPPRKP